MLLLTDRCSGSPVKSADKQSGGGNIHQLGNFQRTKAHKEEMESKLVSSVNKTIGALKDVKEKADGVKTDLKTKVIEKVVAEVQKWAAVGDVIHQHKAASLRKLADKLDSGKSSPQSGPLKTAAKSTSNGPVAAASRVTAAVNRNVEDTAVPVPTAAPPNNFGIPEETAHSWPGTQ